MSDQVNQENWDAVAEWVISNEGYKRFLDWGKLLTEHPLPGVVPHIAASEMTWGEGEIKFGAAHRVFECADTEDYSSYYRLKPLSEFYKNSLYAAGMTPKENPDEFEGPV